MFDSDLRYVMVNDVASEINGVPVAEHLGRRVEDVVPDVAPSFMPVLDAVLRTGEPQLNIEVSGSTLSSPGQPRWWNASVVRLDGGERSGAYVVVVFTEVTVQRSAHERLRLLIDNLFTFVALLSPDGSILELNQAAAAAAGVDPSEVVGTPFWTAPWWRHDPGLTARIRDAVETARTRHAVRFDVEVSLADDRVIPIDFQLAPIVEGGEVTALVPSGLDIAARIEESERVAALAHLSNRLNASDTRSEIIETIISMSGRIENADVINVAVLDLDEQRIHVSMSGWDDDLAQRWAELPLHADPATSFHDAIRTGQPVVVRSHSERVERYPHLADEAARLGIEMTAALPLTDDDGQPIGVVGLGWAKAIDVSGPVSARLALLQDMCERALQRGRRAALRDELVVALQVELLPDPQRITDIDVAVEYLPAVNEIGFGGDWYDVIPVGSDLAFVVGDVVGHGITAASQMAQTKGLLRGLVLSSTLEDIFPTAAEALAASDSYVATAAVVLLDPALGTVRSTLAGHPPPLVADPRRNVRVLDGGLTLPVGLSGPSPTPSATRVEPGSLIVLYTDGLIERRDRDIDEGLGALRRAVAGVPPDATAAVAQAMILEQMVDRDNHDDDIAIITIRTPR